MLLLGRRTYEGFYDAWPARTGPLADKIHTIRKVVVSSTLGSSDWHDTTVAAGDPLDVVRALKAEDGGPILLVGSGTLARAVLGAGLVDEHLQIFPLVLGSGARLYPETPDKTTFELRSSRTTPEGVLLQEYRPVAS